MTRLKADELIRMLRLHPRAGSAELCARLSGINRATLSRMLKTLGSSVISCGESRRRRYALRRSLRGNSSSIPLYRIDEKGQGHEIGTLALTYPQGSALLLAENFWPLDPDMADGWFDGLPYPLLDMRPQGFLGRNFAQTHALDLGLSADPQNWSDDDIVHALSTMGHDLPGDLILGETSYRRFLDSRRNGGERFLSEAQIEEKYPQLAEAALAHGAAGSSAGGEFPKFTSSRQLHDKKVDVIVKFSGADHSAAVRRWSDLLVCESQAASTMKQMLGLPVAESAIYRYAGRTFLEVVRFDRHGEFGRSAVCTLASINYALIGSAGVSWPKTARSLQEAGWLGEADVERVALIWWFGKLIANTDMHEGNLAFRPGLALAPVYDMLPMMYAPLRAGEVPNRTFSPELPLPCETPIWLQAAQAAIEFWKTCAEDERISAEFRQICDDNGRILAELPFHAATLAAR